MFEDKDALNVDLIYIYIYRSSLHVPVIEISLSPVHVGQVRCIGRPIGLPVPYSSSRS